MTAFEMETMESCRSLGIVPADLFCSVPLVEIRPACAKSDLRRRPEGTAWGQSFQVKLLNLSGESLGLG
jgi:hypothetical protein